MELPDIGEDLDTLVLRTDFSDDELWERVCTEIQAPVRYIPDDPTADYFQAYVVCISDRQFEGESPESLLRFAPTLKHSFIFLVDSVTMTTLEHQLLVLDLYDEPGRTFRVIPEEMWNVQNNLSIANCDFEDCLNGLDSDGVYRGFHSLERTMG